MCIIIFFKSFKLQSFSLETYTCEVLGRKQLSVKERKNINPCSFNYICFVYILYMILFASTSKIQYMRQNMINTIITLQNKNNNKTYNALILSIYYTAFLALIREHPFNMGFFSESKYFLTCKRDVFFLSTKTSFFRHKVASYLQMFNC